MQKQIKLYLAILNEGWVRSEHIAVVIMMTNTPNVKLTLEVPTITWGKPIASNRSQIVRRFLGTDCDFLMMMDDDVVPFRNPAEMVFFDRDILGSPTRTRQNGRLNWVVYGKHPKKDTFSCIDLDSVNPNMDLLKVNAIGTGLILIKRKVLEKIKNPFEDVFDENGVRILGMDLNFCKKATEAGFEVYAAPKMICEHFKESGLIELDNYYISKAMDEPYEKYDMHWGEPAIGKNDWDFIKNIIEKEKVKTVLEFGSGLSTLFISEFASVDSFDTDLEWAKKIQAKIPEGRNVHFHFWDGKQIELDKLSKTHDLVFVDGPPVRILGGVGMEASIKIAAEHSDRIIIRNAGMIYEETFQEKYLRKGFDLISRSGWHQARCHYWKRKS